MTDLLSIGASGLKVYSAALAAVGDNIANANTVGYARRSISISEITSGTSNNIIYKPQARFDGSQVNGVTRNVDMFRVADSRLAAADYGKAQTVSSWLQTTETSLGNDISGGLANMFAAGDQLAAAPGSEQARLSLINSIDVAASAIRNTASDFARNATGVSAAASDVANAATADLKSLASLNLLIRHQTANSTSRAELEDQRDRLLDSLSSSMGVTYHTATDGTTLVSLGSVTLVNVGDAAKIEASTASDGRVSFIATMAGATSTIAPTSGTASGLTSVSGTIADRRNQLNGLATSFATTVNNWNAGGVTPAGAAGPPLVSMTGDATTLNVIAVQVGDIAAQGTDGTANGNALALRTAGTANGLESIAAQIVSQHASATSAAKSAEALAGSRRDTADSARDAVEGVDLDREAADMLRYQQAYQGAARMVQVAKETVDAILALFN